MNHKKLKWSLFEIILSVILILLLQLLIFNITPTKATVESFLKENSCNPSALETDLDSEYSCAYYLRRHTALVFGQIIKDPTFSFLWVTNPFGYFFYDSNPADPTRVGCALTDSCKNDEHEYVLVVTRDEGILVYNPVNGKFVGSYNNLMLNMGCKVQSNENSLFSSQADKSRLSTDNIICSSDNVMKRIQRYKLLK